MLQLLGLNAQGQHFGLGHGFVGGRAAGQNAWQFSHFGKPAAIGFAFTFEIEVHADLTEWRQFIRATAARFANACVNVTCAVTGSTSLQDIPADAMRIAHGTPFGLVAGA